MKNKFTHNEDGTTHIFIESKSKRFPGKWTVIIDTEDWEKVKDHRWCLTFSATDSGPYANTSICKKSVKMHHLIIEYPQPGFVTDHKNHNRLDNRKENLRNITKAQNGRNSKSGKNSSSQYKGVQRVGKNWRAKISHERKQFDLGSFSSEEDAALAYNKKAIELWGEEHVLLNEIK